MSTGIGRRSLLGAAAAVAGLALGVSRRSRTVAPVAPDLGGSSQPLAALQVNCGFTARSTEPAALEYGRELRDRVYHDVLAAIEQHGRDGYLAQLRAAEEILERTINAADGTHVATVWLSIEGNVGGGHRSRQYVAAVTS